MPSEPTVFIVDDDPSMLRSIARTVASAGWNTRTYTSGEAFLNCHDSQRPGCLLLDLRMPRMNGLTVQEILSERQSHLPIIFITAFGEVPAAVQAMQAGAIDFLEKPFSEQALLACIERAMEQDNRIRQAQAERDHIAACVARLTVREREVLDLLVAGKLNKEIGETLGISSRTVERHRHQVMQKMQTHSSVDLARMMFTLQG